MKKERIKVIGIGEEGINCVNQLVSYDQNIVEMITDVNDKEKINKASIVFIVCDLKKKTINDVRDITSITKNKGIFSILLSNKAKEKMEDINVDSLIMVLDDSLSYKRMIIVKQLIDLITDESNKKAVNDVKEMLRNKVSIANIGIASGKNRVFKATEEAINNSTLNKSFKDSKNAIVTIMGYTNFSFIEAATICDAIKELIGEDIKTIYEAESNEALDKDVAVTIIAN